MKIELAVKERIILLNILKGMQGDIFLLKVMKKAIDDIGFSEEELTNLNFQFDKESGQTTWTEEEGGSEFEIDDIIVNKIKENFKSMNEKRQLGLDHLSIYEKIVGD